MSSSAVRVILPAHLKTLAGVTGEAVVQVDHPVTAKSLIDALETAYSALRGTIRDPATQRRRPFVRFFALDEDLSHEPLDQPLPAAVSDGREPFFIVGAMAGG